MGDRDTIERNCVRIIRSVRQAGRGTPDQLQGKKDSMCESDLICFGFYFFFACR